MTENSKGKISILKNGFVLMLCKGEIKTYSELLYLILKVYNSKGITLSEYRSIFRFFNFDSMEYYFIDKEVSQEEKFRLIQELNKDLTIPKTEILKLVYIRYEQGQIKEEELKKEIAKLNLVELNNSLPECPDIVV